MAKEKLLFLQDSLYEQYTSFYEDELVIWSPRVINVFFFTTQ